MKIGKSTKSNETTLVPERPPYTILNVNQYFHENISILNFTVTGKPPVQQRARVNFRRKPNNKGIVHKSVPFFYDPSKNIKQQWTKALSDALHQKNIVTPVFGSNPLTDEAISLEIFFIYLVQKWNKKKSSVVHLWPNTKDLDNMLKFVMDVLQGIIYINDNSVCLVT